MSTPHEPGVTMTTLTTTTPDVATTIEVRPTGAPYSTAASQTARRTILQFFRTPQLILMGSIQGALFLFMFRYILGGAINPGVDVSYVDFLVPGFLVTTILWMGMSAPAGVAEDAASGVHDRLRSLPIHRSAVMVGRSLADASLITWGVLITALVGVAVGFRTHGDAGAVVAGFALLLVASYTFTWIFINLGLTARNAQSAQATATLVVVPLTFVSSAYVPIASMPGWLQPVAKNQPVTVICNAVRSLMLGGTDAAGVGHSTGYWVALSLVWCAGIALVFGSLAVSRFARSR
jgi:ABC transporter DrrB family efflux protein